MYFNYYQWGEAKLNTYEPPYGNKTTYLIVCKLFIYAYHGSLRLTHLELGRRNIVKSKNYKREIIGNFSSVLKDHKMFKA